MHLKSLDYEELIEKGVSERFARVISNPSSYHEDLNLYIGKTDWDYFIPENVTDIVPLWDSNANSFVRWNRSGKIEYVWLFHDDPEWSLIANSEQGIIAKLWETWVGSFEDEEEFKKFADALGFIRYKEAMEVWDAGLEEFDQWKKTVK